MRPKQRGSERLPNGIDKLREGAARSMLASLLCVLSFAGVAHAHATLLQTDPPAGARVASVPTAVRLTFDERVEPVFNSLHVVDLSGHRVDDGDSHTAGTLQNFVVPEESPFWRWSGVVAKWLSLTALTIWLGGLFFVFVIVSTSPPSDSLARIDRRSYGLIRSAALVFLLAQLLGLGVQSVTFSELPVLQSIAPSTLSVVLLTTSFGQWWIARFAGAVLLALLCVLKLPGRTASSSRGRKNSVGITAAAFGSFLLLTIPLTGHAHAVPRAAWLAVACDWAHLAATAIWVGGLVHFFAFLRFVDRNEATGIEALSHVIRRFSRTAKISVAILFATGTYAAWLHLPSWQSFVTTSYGLALLVKLIVIVPILAIAAVNLRYVGPALQDFGPHLETARVWAGRFRGLLRTETSLAMLVLVIVAVLTNLPPASAVSGGPVKLSQSMPQGVVELTVSPNKVGQNRVTVRLQDPGGQEISDARQVALYLQMRDMDMGLESVTAGVAPDGTYQADVNLSMAGRWSLSVQVTPAHGDAFVASFDFSSGT